MKGKTLLLAEIFQHIKCLLRKLLPREASNLRRINCRQEETISDIPLIIANRQWRVNSALLVLYPWFTPPPPCHQSGPLSDDMACRRPRPLVNHKPSIVGQIALMRHGILGFLGLCRRLDDSQQSERHLHYWHKPRVIAPQWLLNCWTQGWVKFNIKDTVIMQSIWFSFNIPLFA